MKAIGISKYGGPEVLEMTEIPVTKISDDEVLVKVVAASVNPVDWKVWKGNLKPHGVLLVWDSVMEQWILRVIRVSIMALTCYL